MYEKNRDVEKKKLYVFFARVQGELLIFWLLLIVIPKTYIKSLETGL